MKMKNIIYLFVSMVVLVGLFILLTYLRNNCYPLYVVFKFGFEAENGEVLVNELKGNNDTFRGFWFENSARDWIDDDDIKVVASRDSAPIRFVVSESALCDINDSWTNLNINLINLFVDGERQNVSDDYVIYEDYLDEGTQGFDVDIDYDGKFRTEREIEIEWVSEEKFNQLNL